jgi:hypothetical protein
MVGMACCSECRYLVAFECLGLLPTCPCYLQACLVLCCRYSARMCCTCFHPLRASCAVLLAHGYCFSADNAELRSAVFDFLKVRR